LLYAFGRPRRRESLCTKLGCSCDLLAGVLPSGTISFSAGASIHILIHHGCPFIPVPVVTSTSGKRCRATAYIWRVHWTLKASHLGVRSVFRLVRRHRRIRAPTARRCNFPSWHERTCPAVYLGADETHRSHHHPTHSGLQTSTPPTAVREPVPVGLPP
jgi:hypothetical protein